MAKRSVSVRIRGQDFRIRSDESEDSLRRVASYLDETMARVEQRTGTVDSLGVAMLTALNLAREVLELRESGGGSQRGPDVAALRSLIELAESALEAPAARS
ncbi:MAG: cell division protein ZapA [Myxococcota bacterium]|nr:cell division protein ZapA [Myxococcota bacterium]